MRHKMLGSVLFLMFAALSVNAADELAAKVKPIPTITFLVGAPDGGEVFTIGSNQLVVAGKVHLPNITVDLSRDGGQTFTNIGVINNKRKGIKPAQKNILAWTVTGPVSTNCVIRMTSFYCKKNYIAISNGFSIGDNEGVADGNADIGPQGPAGPTGADGAQGEQGPAGPAGKDGVSPSVSDIVNNLVNNNTFLNNIVILIENNGSFIDSIVNNLINNETFLSKVKGPKGDTGATGAAGAQGPAGPAGVHIVKGNIQLGNAKDQWVTISDASITTTSIVILTFVDGDTDNGDCVVSHNPPTAGSVKVHALSGNDMETNCSVDYLIVNP